MLFILLEDVAILESRNGRFCTGHSIPVDEDHPAQGLTVDPLYFRISILPCWQIPDQHVSRTHPLRFTQNLTHVFL